MPSQVEDFPTRTELWRGCILVTIAAGLWLPRHPQYQDKEWEGTTYQCDDGQGACGVVAFTAEGVAAAFFDHESDRSPFPDEWERDYDWRPFFAGIPPDLLELAEREVLPRMLFDYRRARAPIVTAAFWGHGEQLTGAEAWDAIFDNGGFLLEFELMEPEEAIDAYRVSHHLSLEQEGVLRSLFRRRLVSQDAAVRVTLAEERVFRLGSDEGIDKSRTLLAAVGIVLP